MIGTTAPSQQKHSDDPAMQAYCIHLETWTQRFGLALTMAAAQDSTGRHAWLDLVWDKGVLDLVSPIAHETRAALAKAGTGLPWGGRLDLELYWRVMYSAYAELLAVTDPGVISGGEGIRPMKQVVSVALSLAGLSAGREGSVLQIFTPDADGAKTMLDSVIAQASHQIGLRDGTRRGPKPLPRFSRVDYKGAKANVVGYGFNGGELQLSRETKPDDGAGWTLDVRHGFWTAKAMPWEVAPAP